MFIGFKESLKLFQKILLNPNEVIKGCDLISYNKKSIELIFLIVTMLSGIILVAFSNNLYYINHEISSIILIGPIFLYIGRITIIFIYYVLFRIAITNAITYKNVEILLLPYIVLLMILNSITIVLSSFMPVLKLVFQILVNIWFAIQIYNIIYHKFKENSSKSILLAGLPLILNVVLILVG